MKQMTAQEVLKRYRNGERDFRRINVCGQSFKGQNLAGADFSEADISEADIRSTNFAKANLTQTNFSGAICGIQKRWWLVQQLLALIIAALSIILSLFLGVLIATALFSIDEPSNQTGYQVAGFTTLLLLIVTILSIAFKGFTFTAFFIVAAGSFVGIIVAGSLFAISSNGSLYTVAGSLFPELAVAGSVVAVAVAGYSVTLFVFDVAIVVIGFINNGFVNGSVVTFTIVVTVTIIVVLFSFYITWETRKGNEKFILLRTFYVVFISAIGGTNFAEADLTGSNFNKTVIKSTNLQNTNLTQVSWREAEEHDLARWGSSILANGKVRQLLVSLNGEGEDYQNIDLTGVNLVRANLEGAKFKNAILNRSTLRYANLKNANLREAICIETDFTSADLTGACLQNWNYDHTTKLNGVECQEVFLIEGENGKYEERLPYDKNKYFQKGDFEKIYRKIITSIKLLLQNGMDNPQEVRLALEQLMTENPELSLQGLKKVGNNDLIATIEGVSEGTDIGNTEHRLDELFNNAKLEVRELWKIEIFTLIR
jgi:uncharacterized protein YjbI with pentapeptide repeats